MTAFHLSLDYTLQPGWMAPFIEGLREGRVVARACTACARVSFPPLKSCPCGCRDGTWHTLSGHAGIKARTIGSDGDFALVRFDGASGLATLRLANLPPEATRGTLAPAMDALPQLILGPEKTA